MGHIRLKRLPATRKWNQVVALLANGAPVADVAGASADAAEDALQHVRRDPTLAHSFWLLTQIPLAARAPDFSESARSLGINLGPEPTLMEVVSAFSEAIDRATMGRSRRTDLGEMAQSAAAGSLATIAGADLPGLFGPTPSDVRLALGKLSAPDRFARLARKFFARLIQHKLDYYLSRTLSTHVGPEQRLSTIADHSASTRRSTCTAGKRRALSRRLPASHGSIFRVMTKTNTFELKRGAIEDERLLPRRLLRKLVPVSDMTIWRWERDGRFPQHLTVNGRNYWLYSDIVTWLANQRRGQVPLTRGKGD